MSVQEVITCAVCTKIPPEDPAVDLESAYGSGGSTTEPGYCASQPDTEANPALLRCTSCHSISETSKPSRARHAVDEQTVSRLQGTAADLANSAAQARAQARPYELEALHLESRRRGCLQTLLQQVQYMPVTTETVEELVDRRRTLEEAIEGAETFLAGTFKKFDEAVEHWQRELEASKWELTDLERQLAARWASSPGSSATSMKG